MRPVLPSVRARFVAVLVAGVAVALLAGCTGAGAPSNQNSSSKGYIEGDGSVVTIAPADREAPPSISGDLVGGGTADVAQYRGHPVVLNVWGAWCPPCRAETPELVKSAKELGKQDVTFLGINTKESETSAASFIRTSGMPYRSFYDPDGKLLLGLRKSIPPRSLPSTLVLDAQGRVAAAVIGRVTQAKLSEIVGKVLLESVRTSATATPTATASAAS